MLSITRVRSLSPSPLLLVLVIALMMGEIGIGNVSAALRGCLPVSPDAARCDPESIGAVSACLSASYALERHGEVPGDCRRALPNRGNFAECVLMVLRSTEKESSERLKELASCVIYNEQCDLQKTAKCNACLDARIPVGEADSCFVL